MSTPLQRSCHARTPIQLPPQAAASAPAKQTRMCLPPAQSNLDAILHRNMRLQASKSRTATYLPAQHVADGGLSTPAAPRQARWPKVEVAQFEEHPDQRCDRVVNWFDFSLCAKFRGAAAKSRNKLVPTVCGHSIFQTFEPSP